MGIEVRHLSLWDTLRLQRFVSVPGFLQGLVVPNRTVLSWRCRHGAGASTMRFLGDLRQKYRSDHLWTRFPIERTLLVFAPETIEAVLTSEQNAADPPLKKSALSRFVPEALVISSGDEWRDRRRFNEAALDTGHLHRHHDAFLEIAVREAERLAGDGSAPLGWSDFQSFALRASHQIVLGAGTVRPELAAQLGSMVERSNLGLRDGASFAAFYQTIDRDLARPDSTPTACLMHEAAAAQATGSATAVTCFSAQVGFWMFVLKDALELHVARTLALIAAHPEVQARVREEIRGAGALTATAIDGLAYLEGCIAEQLRLWTPVPILLRRVVDAFCLGDGIHMRAGEQIMIHAGFYHRDPAVFGERADRFAPDPERSASPAAYFFSAHRQSCAGRTLVMFLLKATLAALLRRNRFELLAPALAPARIPYLYDHFGIELRSSRDG